MKFPIEWIKDFADVRMHPDKIAGCLTMAGVEVESVTGSGDETAFELSLTPNRGDCLSVIGVAREIAAVTKAKFKGPKFKSPLGKGKMSEFVKVRIADPKKCLRYSARVIKGAKIGPSPSHIVKRLAACGVRSINNVVDATNYVMIETGQPLHAFDLMMIGGGRIIVQTFKDGTKFKTLDGEERTLSKEDLMICDGRGPVALAGVMGGANSEIKEDTVNLLLESACFEKVSVRRTSRRMGLASESSRRFEKGVDPNGAVLALNRLTEIIIETAGGTPTVDYVDAYPKKIKQKRVRLNENEIKRILGTHVPSREALAALNSLGISAKKTPKYIEARVPTCRPDIERPIDLIEEVARIYGYDKIPETMPLIQMAHISRPKHANEERAVRDALLSCGLKEAVLYGFTSERSQRPFAGQGAMLPKIANPLSENEAVMRAMLLPGLLDILKINLNRQMTDMGFFALQSVFGKRAKQPQAAEEKSVAGIITGRRFPRAWERSKEKIDFYDIKGVVEAVMAKLGVLADADFALCDDLAFMHSGASTYVIVMGERVGFAGELHPDALAAWDLGRGVFGFELEFEKLAAISAGRAVKYKDYSRFPFIERDIAIVVDEAFPMATIEGVISECAEELLADARVFDVYRGEGVEKGKKSVAVTLRFSGDERTLTDEEAEGAQGRIVDKLKSALGASLRM